MLVHVAIQRVGELNVTQSPFSVAHVAEQNAAPEIDPAQHAPSMAITLSVLWGRCSSLYLGDGGSSSANSAVHPLVLDEKVWRSYCSGTRRG